jgi:hypothetical protein
LPDRRSHVRISGGTEWAASSLQPPAFWLGVAQHVLVTFWLAEGARYAPSVRMIKLTEARSITPYKWVHPDKER